MGDLTGNRPTDAADENKSPFGGACASAMDLSQRVNAIASQIERVQQLVTGAIGRAGKIEQALRKSSASTQVSGAGLLGR